MALPCISSIHNHPKVLCDYGMQTVFYKAFCQTQSLNQRVLISKVVQHSRAHRVKQLLSPVISTGPAMMSKTLRWSMNLLSLVVFTIAKTAINEASEAHNLGWQKKTCPDTAVHEWSEEIVKNRNPNTSRQSGR